MNGSTILHSFNSEKEYEDLVDTTNGNQYKVALKYRQSGESKIKGLRSKIKTKEQEMQSVIEELERDKANLDNLLAFRGFDLLREWGILEDEIRDSEFEAIVREVLMKQPESKAKKPKPFKKFMTCNG